MVATSTPRRRRRTIHTDLLPDNVLTAYLRVSTREQADSGAGLDAQKTTLQLYSQMNNLDIREWRIDAGRSAKDLAREGVQAALDDVRSGRTRGIIISKLDRLSRSVLDFSHLMEEAMRDGWNIIVVDLGVDLKTPNGQLVAGIMSQISQWERKMIGVRTKDGLAAKRDQGVRLGRPRGASDDLLDQVLRTYQKLGSYAGAARRLNDAGVETVQGGRRWYPATVRDMVFSQDGQAAMERLVA